MEISVGALVQLQDKSKLALRKAGYVNAADVLLASQDDVGRKTKLSPSEVDAIVKSVSQEILPPPQRLSSAEAHGLGRFTTGDLALDELLGGGFRTGTIWEVVGEGASGKSQLAFQLALTVQLPLNLGGLDGSVCYITAGSSLATARLEQLIAEHPLLSPDHCSLSDIHTCSADIPKALTYYLREALPSLVNEIAATQDAKPLKLIVIDSIGGLFRSTTKASTNNLVERSKTLAEISRLLHGLVAARDLAVLVVNDVSSVFDRINATDTKGFAEDELVYWEQSRWFGRPDDTFRDEKKEASLGLVWANQLNVRLFMSRTGRMKTIEMKTLLTPPNEGDERTRKRRRIEGDPTNSATPNSSSIVPTTTSVLLRRLDVVFSPFAPSQSIDFVLTPAGLRTEPLLTSHKSPKFFGYETEIDGSLPLDPPSSEADDSHSKGKPVVDVNLMADIDYDALWDEDVELPDMDERPNDT